MFKNLFNKEEKGSDSFDNEKLIGIIRELLPDDLKNTVIESKTRFDELGFDSIMYINLILGLEDIVNKDLEVIVSEIDLASIQTVEDLFKTVELLMKNKY